VTGPEGYEEFLRGLAGEYESMQGGVRVKHEAENLGQGFRRFPVIIPVAEREFSIFVNSGVLNGTREYRSFERYEHMRQDLELLARRCKAIKDTAERERVRGAIEARTVAPIVEQHDRIAAPDLEAIDGDDLLAEFTEVGQPIASDDEPLAEQEEPKPTIAELKQQEAVLLDQLVANRAIEHDRSSQAVLYHGDQARRLAAVQDALNAARERAAKEGDAA
jgi:hypothetical protein